MPKQYSPAGQDVAKRIERIRAEWHPELKNVSICSLFVFGDEPGHVLEHQGYAAAATIKITATKDRAAGMADALMVLDRYDYEGFTERQRDAMVDHELYHLERVVDEESGKPKFDSNGRPRLEMRRHDRQFGWFDEVAQRHGEHSLEVIQAKNILASTGQLYFDFFGQTQQAA